MLFIIRCFLFVVSYGSFRKDGGRCVVKFDKELRYNIPDLRDNNTHD